MQCVSGIGLDMDVVAQRTMRPVEELDDAESFVDRFEQSPVPLLALGEGFLGGLQAPVAAPRCAEARIFFLEKLDPALQTLDLVRCHELCRQNEGRAITGVGKTR